MVYQMEVGNHGFFAYSKSVVFCCKSFNVHPNICVCVSMHERVPVYLFNYMQIAENCDRIQVDFVD